MDFKATLEELNETLEGWMEQAKDYFSQLSQEEKYGWMGEGTGAFLFLVGIVLLIL